MNYYRRKLQEAYRELGDEDLEWEDEGSFIKGEDKVVVWQALSNCLTTDEMVEFGLDHDWAADRNPDDEEWDDYSNEEYVGQTVDEHLIAGDEDQICQLWGWVQAHDKLGAFEKELSDLNKGTYSSHPVSYEKAVSIIEELEEGYFG